MKDIPAVSQAYRALAMQPVLELDEASRLLNAAVRRCERQLKRLAFIQRPQFLDRMVLDNDVNRLSVELFIQCMERLSERPLFVYEDRWIGRIEVMGVLAYDIDVETRQVSSRLWHEGRWWPLEDLCKLDLVGFEAGGGQPVFDVFSPLATPGWLRFIAFTPSGVLRNPQLRFVPSKDEINASGVLSHRDIRQILALAFRRLWVEPQFQSLRAELAFWLTKLIGPDVVNVALRARKNVKGHHLISQEVNEVGRNWPAYARMARENPRLLPVLHAWNWTYGVKSECDDAVPLMRDTLIADGFPARAWRCLVKHNPRRLFEYRNSQMSWGGLIERLKVLEKCHWPSLPPRNFLGLLYVTAGMPQSFDEAGSGVPGWFWQWACEEACARQHNSKAYQQLQDEVVQFAWLVRIYQPLPDSNQRRLRWKWLQRWAEKQEARTQLSDEPQWATWLQQVNWDEISEVDVQPILSPLSLRKEGQAFHNCADSYEGRCRSGLYIVLTLRHPDTEKRIAMMGMRRQTDHDAWKFHQIVGPCNRVVSWHLRLLAEDLVDLTNRCDARKATA